MFNQPGKFRLGGVEPMRVVPQLSCGGRRIRPSSKNGVPICCSALYLVEAGIDDAGIREQGRNLAERAVGNL